MKTTGGAIRPDKTFAYPISFDFKPSGEYFFEKVENLVYSLSVKNHEDIREDLDLIDANVGKETLGMFMAPDGTMKDQNKAMKKKVTTWTSHVRSGTIPPRDALRCISSTITKTLEYPICVTTFTKKECNQLVKPIHDAAFPKVRLCRTIPHDIRYGAKDCLGLGLDDLYVSQGIDKVIFYIEEIDGNSMSRPLLRSNMEWAMIHIGIGNCSLFDINYDHFGHLLLRTWIRSLWQFVHEYKIRMPSYEHSINERRDNDKFLMKEFQKAGFSKKQLIKLNRCRFYLHVETLSDITDGKGDQISTLSYTGHKNHYESQLHDWPEHGTC